MSWLYLIIAALFEVGWPLGFKLASQTPYKVFWIIFAVVAMIFSGIFLYIAQKEIPIGTSYAIWTGIGASCTFLIGITFFNDVNSLLRSLGIVLIIAGIVCLKLDS